MSNEDDECDSSSLFNVASQTDVNSFLHSQAAKITGITTSISDDENNSMDGSLLTRFSQISSEKKYIITTNTNIRSTPIKPYLSRSCFASLTSSSPIKNSTQKIYASDDLTELKWLNTFKLKEFKDEFNLNNIKDKDNNNEKTQLISQQQQQQQQKEQNNNNDEDRLAKLISELKSYDYENTKITTTSFGIIIFLGFYSKRDEKHLSWSLTIKQLYEFVQSNAKHITNKRGWKNLLRQALITIPCFVKTKRDLLKSRSLWTIDPYYRPLLTKAYLTNPPIQSSITLNKTLSEVPTNRHDDQLDTNRSSQSIVSNFAPKATVKTKVLPRLYERLCEEEANDDDDHDGDEADSNNTVKRHRSLTSGRKRPRSSSSSGHRQSVKNNDGKHRSSTSPWATKLLKRHKRRHYRQSGVEPKTSTPNRGSNNENRSLSTSTIVTPCPSMDHTYLLQPEKMKHSSKKHSTIKRTKSTGSIEYDDPSSGDIEEDDEHDSNSLIRPIRKSIITTRSQAAAAAAASRNNHSKNRRKSSPPKKRLSHQLTSHRPNTRINRRIIEQDLKLLRQANVLPPLSPPTNQQPLDLSLGPNRSSSYEEIIEQTTITTTTTTTNIETRKDIIPLKTTPIEGVLDLSLSR
ncbi:unnamed protein product [Rotaria sordida]|uniref:Fork-head domain-containing protein n=2 Tax=Rotaria sordida TaxID=392033 RepID=A0A813YK86_9BILA|nr:unnamed protein product [Rotaria sordida]CAF1150497.1 unnamed protein product [Rotaria sordida]CAF1388535.1 unnamed protein product [Rotaria sordida]CAF3588455.1 unnamed protein product [Rotaria sordida]